MDNQKQTVKVEVKEGTIEVNPKVQGFFRLDAKDNCVHLHLYTSLNNEEFQKIFVGKQLNFQFFTEKKEVLH